MSLTEDREWVRTQLGVNIVVEAGAGTGKTFLLIERLCFVLLAQDIAPQRLVALTFTEKAAAEIKTRLLSQLQAVIRDIKEDKLEGPILKTLIEKFGINTKDIAERAKIALAQLDRSQIGTLHSFCADILRLYPLEAGLTPNAEVDKGPRAQRILEGLWNRFLDVELGENAPRAEQWKEVLSHVSLTDIYKCVREMCSGKVGHYNYFAHKDLLAPIYAQYAQRAAYLSGAFMEGVKKPRAIEKALDQAARRLTNTQIWLQSGHLPQETEETISIGSKPPVNWDSQSMEEAKELCRLAEQVDPCVQQWIVLAYELVENLVAEIRATYEKEGILSFDDLLIRTRDLLQHNLQVRHALQEKYDVLYIDEFQDTDPAQGEMLLYLAEQKDNDAPSWDKVKLEPGKLFVVGDPKQSIYRFRGADITAYQLFTDLILKQGGKKAYLRRNFRNLPDILHVTNDVCEVVMTEKPTFQPPYEPIFTQKTEKGNKAAEMVLIRPCEVKDADGYRHNQAEFVASWIEENVGKMTLQNGQKLQYQDIAILSRAGTTLWPYTDALRRWGIPFSVEEDKDFYTRQEVSDFLNILRVLDDPQDRISLVGVMRSPLGTLTEEEIYRASCRKELDYRYPSGDAKLEKLFAWLRSLAAQVNRLPLHTLLLRILEDSFLAEVCAWAYDGQRSIDNLQRLVSLSVGYALQTPSTLGQFLARVEELMTQELGKLTALPEGESALAVNVMTVHKSKGLEFPVVILVDISKKEVNNSSKRQSHLYMWKHDMHGFLIGKYADINLAWLEEQQRQHARCEDVRILYVALTRAREKLLILGNQQTDKTCTAQFFARANMFPSLEEEPQKLGPHQALSMQYISYVAPEKFIYTLHENKREQISLGNLFAWKQAYDKRQAEYQQLMQEEPLLSPSALTEKEFQNEEALQLGSWVHAALARRQLYPRETLSTTVQTVAPYADKQAQDTLLQILENFYKSGAYQTLAAMKVLGAEMPFALSYEKGLVNGVIDLLAQDKDGTVWVLDYKTDQVKAGEEEESAQKYTAQLKVYTQAAQQIYPSGKVKSAIVFVRNGLLIELKY